MAIEQPRPPRILASITDQLRQRIRAGYAVDSFIRLIRTIAHLDKNCTEAAESPTHLPVRVPPTSHRPPNHSIIAPSPISKSRSAPSLRGNATSDRGGSLACLSASVVNLPSSSLLGNATNDRGSCSTDASITTPPAGPSPLLPRPQLLNRAAASSDSLPKEDRRSTSRPPLSVANPCVKGLSASQATSYITTNYRGSRSTTSDRVAAPTCPALPLIIGRSIKGPSHNTELLGTCYTSTSLGSLD
ncbi:hypothetical protein PTTG_10742 [Puccinia triticina 1-1 BBBD Race 1]|uniref:Uncharacterized protein n=1 Tax=Puccinia triticina (isolate 1-1 / race 1 (BBBD)) TaxID=630390 RepID=A0A180G3N8_PUCT1|nr:hypothetical protein PTTG_10742 [Puccinia triticina 1-1 BBBD Race 1]